MGFWHWPGELGHVHAEELPSNQNQRGEVENVPVGWTAQEQARVDEYTTLVAEAEESTEEPKIVHRHKGQ